MKTFIENIVDEFNKRVKEIDPDDFNRYEKKQLEEMEREEREWERKKWIFLAQLYIMYANTLFWTKKIYFKILNFFK